MRSRGLAWLLAIFSCVLVVAGIAVLWKFRGAGLGISVGLPAGATLIAPIFAWAGTAPPHMEHPALGPLERARQVLADRVVAQLSGPDPMVPALPALSRTLSVRWDASDLGRPEPTERGGTDDVAMIADRLREPHSRRLFILGEAGCGKTTLARLLMAHLLAHLTARDPVPVFVSLAAWDPGRCSLREWITQQVCEVAPELRFKPSYGSTAASTLISHGMILPIIDGIDALPTSLRHVTLTSDALLRQDRFIVTCRTPEFDEAIGDEPLTDALTVRPGQVSLSEAERFLCVSATDPAPWRRFFQQISGGSHPCLATALSRPRLIYLANTAYRNGGPAQLLAEPEPASEAAIEERLLSALPAALLPADGHWAQSCPWYRDKAVVWLRFLARRFCLPHNGEFAWGSIFRSGARVYRRYVGLRAVISSTAACLLIAFVNRNSGSSPWFGWLTGIAYGLAIGSACVFLSPPHATAPKRDFSRPAYKWWLGDKWDRSWRIVAASVAACVLFMAAIAVRAYVLQGKHPLATGADDGVVAGMVVALSAIIAGIPAAPRSEPMGNPAFSAAGLAGKTRFRGLSTRASMAAASGLGIAFGLLTGILAVVVHHDDNGGLSLSRGLIYGLIMGLNFAVGAWLVRLARTRTVLKPHASPLAALHAERQFVLLSVMILAVTFGSAFGLDSSLHWEIMSGIANGLVGAIVGTFASEWPLYLAAVTLAACTRKLPLRLMKFLDLCRHQGILLPVGMNYRFCENASVMLRETDGRAVIDQPGPPPRQGELLPR